jgi:hypothetical protein
MRAQAVSPREAAVRLGVNGETINVDGDHGVAYFKAPPQWSGQEVCIPIDWVASRFVWNLKWPQLPADFNSPHSTML